MLNFNETLVTPVNTPIPYGLLTIRQVDTTGIVLPHTGAPVQANAEGEVTFSLVRGTYRVFFTQEQGGIQYPVGYILESVFDNPPDPVTLASILVKNLPEGI